MKSSGQDGSVPRGVLATHRKARRDYQILSRHEAGIALQGTEVKSIRAGRVSLDEAYARVDEDGVRLLDMHVDPYDHGNVFNHEPRRPRRLLLHREEIRRLRSQVVLRGLALIPLRLVLKRGLVKVELGLCRGKHQQDKRDAIRERTAERESARAMAAVRKGSSRP